MAKHLDTYDYEYNNLTIEFHYEYDKGEPMIWSYSNGDPGHPGSGPTISIHKAMLILSDINDNKVSVDIDPLLPEMYDLDLDLVKEEIIDYHANE